MKKILLMLCLLLVACSRVNNYRQVSMREGIALMSNDEDYVLLDVRTFEEYEQFHIPNAICIPNETIDDQEIKQLPNKKQTIYVYCRSGNRSKQASEKLVKLGYEDVIEIGGIIDYQP